VDQQKRLVDTGYVTPPSDGESITNPQLAAVEVGVVVLMNGRFLEIRNGSGVCNILL